MDAQTIISITIGILTLIVSIVITACGIVWQLSVIKGQLSDSVKDLKLELKSEIRDRIHVAKNEIGANMQKQDEELDKMKTDIALLTQKVTGLHKCINARSKAK